ncbi:hypothetical protein HZS_4741, partial [Henneguya salminicola]
MYEKIPYYIYFKNHVVNKETGLGLINGRTIFVCNIPPFLTKDNLKYIFEKLQGIEKIILWGSQTDLDLIELYEPVAKYFIQCKKYAYILFTDVINEAELNVFNKHDFFNIYELTQNNVFDSIRNNRFIDPENIIAVLSDYTQENRVSTNCEPDEDGWITVQGRERLPSLPFKSKKIDRKEKEDDNFCLYSFRRRQIQEEKISMLRRKFEDDKSFQQGKVDGEFSRNATRKEKIAQKSLPTLDFIQNLDRSYTSMEPSTLSKILKMSIS